MDDPSSSQQPRRRPQLSRSQSTKTKLTTALRSDDEEEDITQEPSSTFSSDEVGDLNSNDADLLLAVMGAAEREAQPWLLRFRGWGQENKEGLIKVCAPLWFCAVLILVQNPSVGSLFLFTLFSVCFGSIFDPFEAVHPVSK